MISSGQIMKLTGLVMKSSLEEGEQTELLDRINDLKPSEISDLIPYLEMNQLDITQLNTYTKDDITKRLDYIESQEKM